MRRLILAAATAVASVACAAPAARPAIFINFDAVTTYADVNSFYDGGTDGAGASGPNLGVDFSGWTALTGYGETSQPNFVYDSSSPAIIDVAAGFSDALSFTQGFLFQPQLMSIAALMGQEVSLRRSTCRPVILTLSHR
jgi:hypothetical protein